MTECTCTEVCRLFGWVDQFQPATREVLVFTKSTKRYFDLDAVREPHQASTDERSKYGRKVGTSLVANPRRGDYMQKIGELTSPLNPIGAPPLDWWQIPSPKPQPISPYEGPPMTATMYIGDVLDVLARLPENSVDLVLTSPPFLALRSYLPADHPDKAKEGGSQSTPGEYIDWLIDVVEACDRVLAPHGSLCFELGDTYAGSGGAGGDYAQTGFREGQPKFRQGYKPNDGRTTGYTAVSDPNTLSGLGGRGWPLPKSLSLIPESFRFAMVYGFNPFTGRQTERWRLRNVIRWVRPNPPVGALGDKFRPATSELMVFCKSAKRYFDLDAVREPPTAKPQRFLSQSDVRSVAGPKDKRGRGELSSFVSDEVTSRANPAGAPPLDWWNIPPGGYEGAHYAVWPPELLIKPIKAMCPLGGTVLDPFVGSGTTLAVATGHGRNAIGIDLDSRNYDLALERVGPLVLQRGEVAA